MDAIVHRAVCFGVHSHLRAVLSAYSLAPRTHKEPSALPVLAAAASRPHLPTMTNAVSIAAVPIWATSVLGRPARCDAAGLLVYLRGETLCMHCFAWLSFPVVSCTDRPTASREAGAWPVAVPSASCLDSMHATFSGTPSFPLRHAGPTTLRGGSGLIALSLPTWVPSLPGVGGA